MKARMIDIMILDAAVALLMGVAMGTSGCGQTTNNAAGEISVTTEEAADSETNASVRDENAEDDAADAVDAGGTSAQTTDGAHAIKIYTETSYEARLDDDDKVLVNTCYPTLTCSEETGYEALKESLKETSDAIKEEALLAADEYEGYAQDAIKDGQWVNGAYYTYYMDTELVRADSGVVSLLVNVSANSGGAHPNAWYETYTYDAQTGKELSIQDVLQDGQYDQLSERLATALMDKYSAETFTDGDPTALLQQDVEQNNDFRFTLGQKGITFYFSTYELAPYAAGPQTVTIAYADAPELVKEEYTQAPENYITVITDLTGTTIHDEDESAHTLSMTATETEDDTYNLTIALDDMALEDTVMYLSETPYLVHEDGRNYLYLELSTYNDWKSIKVYDLNGAPSLVGEIDRWFRDSTLSDPDNMELATRTNLLSTNECWRTYCVGEDGMPEATQDYDYITGIMSSSLTTRKDMSVKVRDAVDGKAVDAMLPAGTDLYFYATDGESWVDFKTRDAHYVRIENISTEDWPYTVDGVDAETLFDGMAYAG